MLGYYILTGLTFFGLFIIFLILSKTLNGIINQLLKLEYMLQKEFEYKKEELEISQIIEKSLENTTKDDNDDNKE